MTLGPSARAFVRLGLLLLLGAVAASVWHMMASQIPSSPWRADVLPGPVAQLRDACFALGVLSFVVAWLMPLVAVRGEPKKLVIVTHVGVVITLGALAYGATTGMFGVQIDDPRPDSRALLLTRFLGELILLACFVIFSVRVVKGLRDSMQAPSA